MVVEMSVLNKYFISVSFIVTENNDLMIESSTCAEQISQVLPYCIAEVWVNCQIRAVKVSVICLLCI